MKKYLTDSQIKRILEILPIIFVVAVAYFIFSLSVDVKSIKNDLASTTAKVLTLESDLATTTKTNQNLSQMLIDQQNKSNNIGNALNNITNTVGTLEKLSKTDKELLQKYSKIYFLNENYVPLRLAQIDPKYLQDKNKNAQFHEMALPFLVNMLDDSVRANSAVLVVSAYRSFGTQAALKSSYTVTYGTGANKFSSDQGYSEHQLGTAIDISGQDNSTLLTTNFDSTAAYNWLVNNAYRYGFILSYPKGNAYYQYEPWHWRFVGVRLATFMHNQNKNFYDLDQRVIDTYLATIFD